MKVARSWIGTSESDAIFNERFDRLLSNLDAAIVESLRSQLAVFVLDRPASVGTPDGTTVNFAENIKALREQLALFTEVGGAAEVALNASIAKITRSQYR